MDHNDEVMRNVPDVANWISKRLDGTAPQTMRQHSGPSI